MEYQEMECREFEEQIVEYLEQGMTLQERRAFCQHLLCCRNCRTLIDDIRDNIEVCRRSSNSSRSTPSGNGDQTIRFFPSVGADIQIVGSTIGERISCRSLDMLISDYFDSSPIDGDTKTSPAAWWGDLFSQHLLDCPACVSLFEGLREASAYHSADCSSSDHQQAQLEARIIAATAGIRH
jgi:hypothetical protein